MRGAWSLMMDEMVEKKEGGSNDIHSTQNWMGMKQCLRQAIG